MEVKMKYIDLGSMQFVTTVQKIANTPTASTRASVIRDWVKAIQNGKDEIKECYQKEIMEVFGQKNEDGTLKRPEGEPNSFVPDETKEKELMEANEAFGLREATIKLNRPITPSIIQDVKITAHELDLLGNLFSDQDGPGLPNMAPQMQPRQKELTQ